MTQTVSRAATLRAIAICALAALALAAPRAASAAEVDSVYRTYDWQNDCQLVDDGGDEPPGMGAKLICPGPGGLYLMLADSDARISLDYGAAPVFGPWESFASFSTVHDTVEWRRQRINGRMQVFATIHRWIVGPDPSKREILVISTVAQDANTESCIVAYIDTTDTPNANRLARRVADRHAPGFVCGNARPRAFGYVGLDTPVPHRVTPH